MRTVACIMSYAQNEAQASFATEAVKRAASLVDHVYILDNKMPYTDHLAALCALPNVTRILNRRNHREIGAIRYFVRSEAFAKEDAERFIVLQDSMWLMKAIPHDEWIVDGPRQVRRLFHFHGKWDPREAKQKAWIHKQACCTEEIAALTDGPTEAWKGCFGVCFLATRRGLLQLEEAKLLDLVPLSRWEATTTERLLGMWIGDSSSLCGNIMRYPGGAFRSTGFTEHTDGYISKTWYRR